jgi:hypothetical protein
VRSARLVVQVSTEREPVDTDIAIAIGIIHISGLIREGIKDVLGREPGVRVRGTFENAREAFTRPIQEDHVLLYDLSTIHQDGVPRPRAQWASM